MNPKIIQEDPISLYELEKEIKAIKKRDEEMNIRSKKTEEYLQDFVSIKLSEAEELQKELESLNVPRLKTTHIIKLVDTLPDTPEEVKIVLQGYTITISKENLNKIAGAIKKYVKE